MNTNNKAQELEALVKMLIEETSYLLRHCAMAAEGREEIRPSDIARMRANADRLDQAVERLG